MIARLDAPGIPDLWVFETKTMDRHLALMRLPQPTFGCSSRAASHRITRLRRQGEGYFADGLRELPDNRRVAILAVCAVEWEMFLADVCVFRSKPITDSGPSRSPPRRS